MTGMPPATVPRFAEPRHGVETAVALLLSGMIHAGAFLWLERSAEPRASVPVPASRIAIHLIRPEPARSELRRAEARPQMLPETQSVRPRSRAARVPAEKRAPGLDQGADARAQGAGGPASADAGEESRTIDVEAARATARALARATPDTARAPLHGPAPVRTPERVMAEALARQGIVERREGDQWVLVDGKTRCVLSAPAGTRGFDDRPFVPKCAVVRR